VVATRETGSCNAPVNVVTAVSWKNELIPDEPRFQFFLRKTPFQFMELLFGIEPLKGTFAAKDFIDNVYMSARANTV
jgi:hypothetical protein